jgi:hypothetical protein
MGNSVASPHHGQHGVHAAASIYNGSIGNEAVGNLNRPGAGGQAGSS